jgi:hypothetical protein
VRLGGRVTDTPSSSCARSISYLTCTLSAARKNPPSANSAAVTTSARGCSNPSACNARSRLAWLTRLTSRRTRYEQNTEVPSI